MRTIYDRTVWTEVPVYKDMPPGIVERLAAIQSTFSCSIVLTPEEQEKFRAIKQAAIDRGHAPV